MNVHVAIDKMIGQFIAVDRGVTLFNSLLWMRNGLRLTL